MQIKRFYGKVKGPFRLSKVYAATSAPGAVLLVNKRMYILPSLPNYHHDFYYAQSMLTRTNGLQELGALNEQLSRDTWIKHH